MEWPISSWISGRDKNFYSPITQDGSEVHPASYSMATGVMAQDTWRPEIEDQQSALFNSEVFHMSELGSSDGIATDYGLDGRGSNLGGDEIFPLVQTDPGAKPASCKMGTGSFPGVKCGRGVLLTTHTLLVPPSWKSRAIPLPTLWAKPGL